MEFKPLDNHPDGGKVRFHHGFDVRSKDFDRQILTGTGFCQVDLGQGCRSQRLGIDFSKDFIHGSVKIGFDLVTDSAKGFGGNLILEVGQLSGDLYREYIDTDTQKLTQLDQDSAQIQGQFPIATRNGLPAGDRWLAK